MRKDGKILKRLRWGVKELLVQPSLSWELVERAAGRLVNIQNPKPFSPSQFAELKRKLPSSTLLILFLESVKWHIEIEESALAVCVSEGGIRSLNVIFFDEKKHQSWCKTGKFLSLI